MKYKVLHGHTSPDTAFVVDDYPFGFRLRCKIRYWLEHKPKQGYRLVSQTTDPRTGNVVWNKPKASTYSHFGLVIQKEDAGDETGHVGWVACSAYSFEQCLQFWNDYKDQMTEDEQKDFIPVVVAAAIFNKESAYKFAENKANVAAMPLKIQRLLYRLVHKQNQNSMSNEEVEVRLPAWLNQT